MPSSVLQVASTRSHLAFMTRPKPAVRHSLMCQCRMVPESEVSRPLERTLGVETHTRGIELLLSPARRKPSGSAAECRFARRAAVCRDDRLPRCHGRRMLGRWPTPEP
jgi:hypothetical protein